MNNINQYIEEYLFNRFPHLGSSRVFNNAINRFFNDVNTFKRIYSKAICGII
ncbi:hypothetical protein [Polaribacter sp.]|uniref:hypothetical protein n=1 Tax=Polaribacter sp. TaxID=1920175 RepID=UPI003F6B4E0D